MKTLLLFAIAGLARMALSLPWPVPQPFKLTGGLFKPKPGEPALQAVSGGKEPRLFSTETMEFHRRELAGKLLTNKEFRAKFEQNLAPNKKQICYAIDRHLKDSLNDQNVILVSAQGELRGNPKSRFWTTKLIEQNVRITYDDVERLNYVKFHYRVLPEAARNSVDGKEPSCMEIYLETEWKLTKPWYKRFLRTVKGKYDFGEYVMSNDDNNLPKAAHLGDVLVGTDLAALAANESYPLPSDTKSNGGGFKWVHLGANSGLVKEDGWGKQPEYWFQDLQVKKPKAEVRNPNVWAPAKEPFDVIVGAGTRPAKIATRRGTLVELLDN